jgi:hypothetical protein
VLLEGMAPVDLVGVAVALALAAGCGAVPGNDRIDAGEVVDAAVIVDAPTPTPTIDGGLGSQDHPARSCAELLTLVGPTSGLYWLSHPDGRSPAFEVYCDQETNLGGWAMVENSVMTEGKTTAFWQFPHVARLDRMGTPAPDQNYYQGALYLIGTTYMDVFVDLEGKQAVAAVMTTTGIDSTTMHFAKPTLVLGNRAVFDAQFASGWSSKDLDADPYAQNCATVYGNVAQHYSSCWTYNLGVDAEGDLLDGGVGPHVVNSTLTDLGLALQPEGGGYSRVKRIARFTRW